MRPRPDSAVQAPEPAAPGQPADARRLLAAWTIDALIGATPLIIAAPLIVPLLLSEQPVDLYAGRAVAAMLACLGWLLYVAHGLGAALFAAGKTLGRRRIGLELGCRSRLVLSGRALLGPVFFALCVLASSWPLLFLWPATYLLLGRGPSDALFRCRTFSAGRREK